MSQPHLDTNQIHTVNRLDDIADRCCSGAWSDQSWDEAVASVRAVNADPLLLGVALGHALARAKVGGPMTGRTPADLFRALGADEQVAVAVLDHQYGERISDGKDDNQ